MSMLSTWLHKASAFVSNAIANASADQHAVLTDTSTQLSAAAQATEAALPVLAKVMVDGMLTAVGGGQYVPAFNELLDVLAAEILSRKTVKAAT